MNPHKYPAFGRVFFFLAVHFMLMFVLIRKVLTIFSLVGLLFVFLFYTNPNELPLPALFVPFILLYVLTLYIFREIARIFLSNVKVEHRRWIVGALSLMPIALLLTMSAGQTDFGDFVLFVLFVVLIFFYFSRTNFLK